MTSPPQKLSIEKLSIKDSYWRKDTLAVFLFGISSGFPLTLVLSITATWLADSGVSKSDIGLFALATLPYGWKFLWSPAIDQLSLGPLTRLVGRRRDWLALLSALMALLILLLARLDPATDLYGIAVIIAVIAFISASLDIVIDACRIEILPERLMGHGAAMATFGYRAGNLIAGYGTFKLAHWGGWAVALSFLVLLLLPCLVAACMVGEPPTKVGLDRAASAGKQLQQAVIMPFREFTKRDNWLLILLFILVFKLGDAVTAIMTQPLIVELGYTLAEQADANKLAGSIALWLGIALGSLLYFRVGTYRALLFTGILMMMTNLAFALLASAKPNLWLLGAVIGAENFATGLGTTVLVAYLSGLCNIAFTATQYALLSSLASQGRTLFASSSGFIADHLGWVPFFILTTLMAVPGLMLLLILMKKGVKTQADTSSPLLLTVQPEMKKGVKTQRE